MPCIMARMEDECIYNYCAISWIQEVHFMVDSHCYYQNNSIYLSLPFLWKLSLILCIVMTEFTVGTVVFAV